MYYQIYNQLMRVSPHYAKWLESQRIQIMRGNELKNLYVQFTKKTIDIYIHLNPGVRTLIFLYKYVYIYIYI
jgi:hypothetical protein